MLFLTIIMTMVMMTMISAMMIVTKYSLPTIDFATRYSTRYSNFLVQPDSNPTQSKKSLLVCACSWAGGKFYGHWSKKFGSSKKDICENKLKVGQGETLVLDLSGADGLASVEVILKCKFKFAQFATDII